MDAVDSGTHLIWTVLSRAARPAVTWTARPALPGLIAFAAYLVGFVTAAGLPLARHLNVPDLRQYWTDVQFYAWCLGWWPYAVSHWVNPLFSDQIGAPHGIPAGGVTIYPMAPWLASRGHAAAATRS